MRTTHNFEQMKESKDKNKKMLNRKYINNYIGGYTNTYRINLLQSGLEKSHYKKKKIVSMMMYLGIPLKYKRVFEIMSPSYLAVEFIFSLFILAYKCIVSFFFTLKTKNVVQMKKIQIFPLRMPSYRLREILKCYPKEKEIIAIRVPFVKSETTYKEYSMYSGIKKRDCGRALLLSVRLLFIVFYRYHKYDFLFRTYNSYEYFLSCLYIEQSDESNQFIYFSTIDRWAFLFGNDTYHQNVFIQHGILEGSIQFVKYRAPNYVYYINKHEQMVFEQNIYLGKPRSTYYRPGLEFTSNEKLKDNGKLNLLIICCNRFLDQEKKYIQQLAEKGKYNIYIKPHPGFKDHSEYFALQKKYKLEILDKGDFPAVDKVISYDSTLAIEYENMGVSVLRYDDANFCDEFYRMIDTNMKGFEGLSRK